MPIRTRQDLIDHLELALEVELSTVPPYLYAMYSIEDQQSDAAKLIRSVVTEEMLHAVLVANLMLAVGGDPKFAGAEPMPTYPSLLKHHRPALELALGPCTPELIHDVFMVIEQPKLAGAPAEEDVFETLGQFYEAMETAIIRFDQEIDLFADPQPKRQLSNPAFYAPVEFDAEDSGGLMLIDDVESACAVIEIIVHQGEGLTDEKWADPSHQELTHYQKFKRLADGAVPIGPVYPVLTNPKTGMLPAPLRTVSDLFNALYRFSYVTMDELFQDRADKGNLVGRLYQIMSHGMAPVAQYLARQDVGNGRHAGPTFERYDFGADPVGELKDLAERAAHEHPGLTGAAVAIAAM
jgi:rubrerythrin